MKKNKYRYLDKHYWIRKFCTSNLGKLFFSDEKLRKNVFNSIYKSNYWRDYNEPDQNQSYSGKGSDIETCKKLIFSLSNFINVNKIIKILDLACGDFLWMNIVLSKTPGLEKYTGTEIVTDIVNRNNNLYKNDKITFLNKDILDLKIDDNYDFIIARDLFIHLDNESINKVIRNIKRLNPRFFGISSTPEVMINKNLKIHGRYRPINFEVEPFNFNNTFAKLEDGIKDGMKDYLNIYETKNINI